MAKGYEDRVRDKHAEKMRQATEKAKAEKAKKSAEQKPAPVDQSTSRGGA